MKPNRLIIVGAGNFGREVLAWAHAVPEDARDWEIGGFLDSRRDILDGYDYPETILGDPETYEITARDRFICAVGDPTLKLDYCRMLEARGAIFTSVIHPTAIIGPHSTIGEGSVLCPYVVVSTDATIGKFVTLNLHATTGHDSKLSDGCTLSPHADATGWVTLEEGVFMGSHATVIPKVRVGAYTVIGAGSVVVRDVPDHVTVAGVPARVVGYKEKD